MNKDAYYFPHDSNAKDDPKCIMLIEELGVEGYGIFWVLIETLRDQPGYKAELRIIPAIARRYNTTAEKVKAVVMRYELFEVEDEKFFFSPSLIDRMMPLEQRREQSRLAGIKSGEIRRLRAKNERSFNGSSTDAEPVEESRVEERRVEESRVEERETHTQKSSYDYRPPTLDQVMTYAQVHAIPEKSAKEFYWHYDGLGWENKQGQPIKNWTSFLNKWNSRQPQFETSKNNGSKNSKRWDGELDAESTSENVDAIFESRRKAKQARENIPGHT